MEDAKPENVGTHRRGRRSSGECIHILEAARSCFAERGYDRATIRQIAARAQMDPAMVYYFFESKARLFTEALAIPSDPVGRLTDALEQGLDGAGKRIVRHFLAVWDSAASMEPLLVLLRSAPTDERSAAIFTEYVQREIIERIAAAAPRTTHLMRACAPSYSARS
ncbi:transcriptional regulator, TetR family [Pseudonocardia ammonioxydans]|uniref:Transcriptional regulator, TetR family n=1 Tax=Pseudonocardia ammonioxydans TaxID=260086 RepID=A0A1I5HLS2_PSUAM|nr:TetR/AcrR family transcriptional regulator [Pseudonocardia ammonioxydans]SFO49235.1 transcriptional regulator, TetR family [Pseudonocardia ammonioxydans]